MDASLLYSAQLMDNRLRFFTQSRVKNGVQGDVDFFQRV